MAAAQGRWTLISPEEVEALYALVDNVDCKGLCASHCSRIGMGAPERTRMVEKGIVPPEMTDDPCRHLGRLGRKRGLCLIHGDHPLICRLFGSVPSMRCPYGCEPTMTDAQGRALLNAAFGSTSPLTEGYLARIGAL